MRVATETPRCLGTGGVISGLFPPPSPTQPPSEARRPLLTPSLSPLSLRK